MDSIFYIILIIIIIRFVNHFMKQSKEKSGIEKFGETNGSDLEYILNRYGDFSSDEIIESSVGFYLFSIDRKNKDFIFITEEETVYRLSYDNLRKYSIEEVSDDIITIKLNTTFTQKPIISIECFNRIKALSKLPSFRQNTIALDELYNTEIEKMNRLNEILGEIADAGNVIAVESTPPPYIDRRPRQTDKPIIKSDLKSEKADSYKGEIIRILDAIKKSKEAQEALHQTDDNRIAPQQEEIINIKKENTENLPEDIPGKVRISLTEVEEYSRGKFLDSDIQSIFSDARMRGKKYIYITEEQLENLKK